MTKISWGVLSTARIGVHKVIPSMQKGEHAQITALASRNLQKAQESAQALGIPKAYGSYEELLADKEVEAVYISLPNHLHVEWAIKCLHAGKHVLCEKPLGKNLQEAEDLWREAQRFPDLKIMEAFMYRHHPQWARVKALLAQGAIGELQSVHAIFTYYNVDPADVRNQAALGGGGLLDIGCYCVSASRLLFGEEPRRVCGTLDYDPKFHTDRIASGVLEFARGTATFTCATQTGPHQRISIYGTQGRIEMAIPFTPQALENPRLVQYGGADSKEHVVEACDQYTQQGDLFSQAILNKGSVFTPLADAVANMRVLEGIVESHQRGSWVQTGIALNQR